MVGKTNYHQHGPLFGKGKVQVMGQRNSPASIKNVGLRERFVVDVEGHSRIILSKDDLYDLADACDELLAAMESRRDKR